MKSFIKRNYLLIIFCLVSFVSLVYRIEISPPLLNQDEASFANAANSISNNLRDENNRTLPLYFETLSSKITDWKNPFLIYWTAIFIKILGFSVFSTRLATVFLGLISLVFLWKSIELIFPDKKFISLFVSLLVLTSPLFFIQSRINIDPISLVPLTTIEIYFLLRYHYFQKQFDLTLASVFAGINFYTYSPARLYSILILVVGILIFSKMATKRIISKKDILNFFMPLFIVGIFVLPTLIWQAQYPFRVTGRYSTMLMPINIENITSGLFTNYLRYFDFSFLFGSGDPDLLHSTGRAGVFLYAALIFFVIGIYESIKRYKNRVSLFLLILVALYPIGLFVTKDPYRACRGIFILSVFPLVFAFGINFLYLHSRKILVLCVLLFVIQAPIVMYDLYISYPIRNRLSWQYRYQLAKQVEDMLILSAKNPQQNFYIDDAIYFAIDDLTYYRNVHNIQNNNIIFTDDIGIASKSGSLLLTNRVIGEGNVPLGCKIKSGWDGYYLLEKNK